MTRAIRTPLALLLALILSITSVSMALARGDMAVHGSMILCIGGYEVSVALGPDGQPLIDEHICPDCVIGALAAPEPAALATPDATLRRLTADRSVAHLFSPIVQEAQARGPPTFG